MARRPVSGMPAPMTCRLARRTTLPASWCASPAQCACVAHRRALTAQLMESFAKHPKIKVVVNEKSEGLIRSRTIGADNAHPGANDALLSMEGSLCSQRLLMCRRF